EKRPAIDVAVHVQMELVEQFLRKIRRLLALHGGSSFETEGRILSGRIRAPMIKQPPAIAIARGWHWPAAIVLFVIVSRAASLSPFEDTNRDGPVYVNALKLDRTYDVPSTPGKLGFVLAAAAIDRLGVDPIHAYGAVTIG